FGFGVRFGLRFLVEDDLDDSGAITHVEEEQVAKVAAARDPAENDGGFASVGGAKSSAIVSAFQVTEKVQQAIFSLHRSEQSSSSRLVCFSKAAAGLPHSKSARLRRRPLRRTLQKFEQLGLGEFL